ncbi:FecR family protein [Chitinophaga lutea]
MKQEEPDIYQLLVKKHYGGLSPEEEETVEKILAEDPAARALLAEIQSVPEQEARDFASSLDPEAAYEAMLAGESAARRRRIRIRAGGMLTAAAAVAAFLIFRPPGPDKKAAPPAITADVPEGAATLRLANGKVIAMSDSGQQSIAATGANVQNNNRSLKFDVHDDAPADAGWNTLTVPAKLDYQIELSDGTIVWLNSRTQFRFPFVFAAGQREVFIDNGEAYFKIAPNANKPFIVQTARGPVRVLGTEFNVNAYSPQKVVTSLVKGSVAVTADGRTEALRPGFEAVAATDRPLVVQDFDEVNTLSWREGIHYFASASISEIAIMLERWFDTPLIIDNPGVRSLQLRGKLYRNKPLQVFIDQINLTGVAEFYWKGGELHVR